jgi:hypothetical protein
LPEQKNTIQKDSIVITLQFALIMEKIGSKHQTLGSIVATIEFRLVATIPKPQSSFSGCNLDAGFDLDLATAEQQRAGNVRHPQEPHRPKRTILNNA